MGQYRPTMTIIASDILGMYKELVDRGADVLFEPRWMAWHVPQFDVRDLNGYVLRFGA